MEIFTGIVLGVIVSLLLLGLSAYYYDDDEPSDGRLHGRVKR